jgi:hypothetical protein
VHLTFIPELTKAYLPENDLFVRALTACVKSAGIYSITTHAKQRAMPKCAQCFSRAMPRQLFLNMAGI